MQSSDYIHMQSGKSRNSIKVACYVFTSHFLTFFFDFLKTHHALSTNGLQKPAHDVIWILHVSVFYTYI